MTIKPAERCAGSYKPARNIRNLSHLGDKFFNNLVGTCSQCGGQVNVARDGKGNATAHKPRSDQERNDSPTPDFETETRMRIARLHSVDAATKARTANPESQVDYAKPEVVALSHMTVRELVADANAAALLVEIADEEGWS